MANEYDEALDQLLEDGADAALIEKLRTSSLKQKLSDSENRATAAEERATTAEGRLADLEAAPRRKEVLAAQNVDYDSLPAGLQEWADSKVTADIFDDAEKVAEIVSKGGLPTTQGQPGQQQGQPAAAGFGNISPPQGAALNTSSVDQQIADAENRGDVKAGIALKAQRASQNASL